MQIEAAEIKLRDGRHTPFVRVAGRWYCIETEPPMLALGAAFFQPVAADLQEDWHAAELARVHRPADEATGRAALHLENFTDDAQVVKLARRFYELASESLAKEGPLV